ncbi:MAG: AMP-binding protein [Verrucomicrobia bacterium]|nr:AMP-binding protein [Verrucomicrobiota bacterium]
MLDSLLEDTSAKLPFNVALVFEGKSYTYADLCRLTRSLSAALQEQGVQPGDRVAFLLPNCLEIVLCYYACFKIGAIAVPLNVRFSAELLQYAINHSGARVLISEPNLYAQIGKSRMALPEVKQCYLTSRHLEFEGVRPFAELLAATTSHFKCATSSANRTAAIYYTSGTTGLPKAVIHTHASLARATQNQIDQITVTSTDTTLILFPICYLIGFGSQILPFHKVGATCVLLPEFEPQATLAAIEKYRATKTYAFPKLYRELIDCPDAGAYNVKSLTFCFSAGEAIATAIQRRFKQIFGVEITEGCGMTELQIYSMNPPYAQKKIGSIGKPIAGMELSLIDESGCSISTPRQVGEMIVRGGSMTGGYWRDATLTSQTIKDGWFHTGDLAYRDEQGFYWFVSRKSEIIKNEAGLVSPIEVEGALYEHPAVMEAGVVGVPDEFGSEVPQAYVVLRQDIDPPSESQLIAFLRSRLLGYKVPTHITITDNLPHGPTGKIDRKTLRKKALAPH